MIKPKYKAPKKDPQINNALEKGITEVVAKFKDLPHAAAEMFNGGSDAIAFIKGLDPSNLSGSVRPALDIMTKLLKFTDPMNALKGMLGGGAFGALISAISQIQSSQNSSSNPNQGPNAGEPCTIFELSGTLQHFPLPPFNNELTCVPDKPAGMSDQVYQSYLKLAFPKGKTPKGWTFNG